MTKSFNLARLCTFAALLMLISIFLTLSARSVWMDEAMLMKNIFEIPSPGGFMGPLPYYDQAEPVVASWFFKAVTSIFHYNIRPLRLSVLAMSCLMIAPIALLLRQYRWGLFVFLVALIGNSFSTGFHFTELKYYFLEMSGSFLTMLAIREAEERRNIFWILLVAALISLIGFSTLIISGGLLAYAALWFLTQDDGRRRGAKITVFLAACACVGLSYLYMKYMTVYQIHNYTVYVSGSHLDALKVLALAVLGAYGKALLIVSVIASAALLIFGKRGFIYQLNLFFCAMVLLVTVGKLLGFYPATYPRHVIWLVPFSLVISTFAILEFSLSTVKTFRVLGWVLFAILSLQAIKTCYLNYTGDNYEYTDNNRLYEYISDMPPSDILVHPNAQPSLEYYEQLDPGLNKHHFIAPRDDKTQFRNPRMELVDLQNTIDVAFQHRPAGTFYFISSHLDLPSDQSSNGRLLDAVINKYHCTYTSVLKVTDAELLKMNCGAAHD
jgi:hypothetical protein